MADTNRDDIPVVDFGDCSLDVSTGDLDYTSKELQDLAYKIVDACSTVGFVYLRNHGIQETEIKEARSKADEFLDFPIEVKEKYAHQVSTNHGWERLENERIDPERPGDLKECFNAVPSLVDPKVWPDEVVPDFKRQIMKFIYRCDSLSHRVLRLLALGLKMEDLDVFTREHNFEEKAGCTTLRFLYYPPVTMDVKHGQIRLGEHTDYGSISLLFQDNVGGLEVQRRDGNWMPATPIPGTILVIIADAMQRWTSDKLVSTPHRVFVPETAEKRIKARRSIVYFLQPDDDSLIKCLDGSDKYTPITSKAYCEAKFNATYG